MKPSIPIFVPSKGRPDSSTLRLLKEEGIHAVAVIEPQEQESYYGKGYTTLTLPKDDQGLAYSRQIILEHAYENLAGLHSWYWMLDDDIKAVYRRDATKKRCDKTTFKELFKHLNPIILKCQHTQVALEYQQLAWATKAEGKRNGYCDVMTAISARRAFDVAAYRPDMVLKEDRDFTLQIITSGQTTFRYQGWAFAAPKNGSNDGGLHDLYAKQGREEQAVDRMVKAWPGVVSKQTKPDGRIDCKINWKLFN